MLWLWVSFILFVLVMLALDLGVFHKKAEVITVRDALTWSGIWIGLSLAFNVLVYFIYENHWFGVDVFDDEPGGRAAAILFFTGYVIEKSLSVDNIFVISIIFSYFATPLKHQHRVLFWGILGALVMRGAMIIGGTALITRYHWILYVFGALLVFSAIKMLTSKHAPNPGANRLVNLAKRWFSVTDQYVGQHFTTRIEGKLALTPLALVLIVVESTDLLFAVDSIPAIFAITDDPFLVFSSNVFAMMGLRSLYFALAGIIQKFYYLKLSLALLLALVGVKMLLKDVLHALPGKTYYTLGAIAIILTGGIVASLIRARRHPISATPTAKNFSPGRNENSSNGGHHVGNEML